MRRGMSSVLGRRLLVRLSRASSSKKLTFSPVASSIGDLCLRSATQLLGYGLQLKYRRTSLKKALETFFLLTNPSF